MQIPPVHVLIGVGVLFVALLIAATVLGRRERRDQELAERMKRAAALHQHGTCVRSFKDPAAKGFQRPGGGTAA